MRRTLKYSFALLGVLVLSCLLYLLFADLGRHKGRLEGFITRHTGREFAIDGPFRLELFPNVRLHAERVRFANAAWGSKPQMVQVEHLSAEVGLWSLVSGPVDVHSFELNGVVVLLERQRSGRGNWVLREPTTGSEENEPKTRTQFPLVIHQARLSDIRVLYRAAGSPELAARLDELTIAPGANGLLALDGRGALDRYPISLRGEAGPVDALLSGRDVRMNLKGSLGRLALDVEGSIGDLDPLDGANLKIQARGEDIDAVLGRLNLPMFASGTLAIDALLKDAGKATRFELKAAAGDLSLQSNGTLSGLYLRGSDVSFDATAGDAARLATVLGLDGVPAAPLTVQGRVQPSRKEIRFTAVKAQLAGVAAQIDGTLKRGRRPSIDMQFDATIDDLASLRPGLPRSALTARGSLALDAEKFSVGALTATLGDNPLNGSFSMSRGEPRRFQAELTSPRFDLTPYLPQSPQPEASPKAKAAKPKNERFFSDVPLPVLQLKGAEANLRVAVTELAIAGKTLKDVEATLALDSAHVTLNARGKGSLEGAVDASLTLEPAENESANVKLKIDLVGVRAGLDMKDMQPEEVPPLNVQVELITHGRTARDMAENSNGRILLTQGPGKTKATFLNAFGGDVINQLRGKLNPFRTQDPFTLLECTVVRAEVTDGAVVVQPMLMQTQKVTVVAKGKLNLHDEHITLDFDTRPRKGIGVSPGMFTTPFIRLEGTLTTPRVAMGAKGFTSGAVAAATGGLSVVASGFIDRLKGEANMCRSALAKATEKETAGQE